MVYPCDAEHFFWVSHGVNGTKLKYCQNDLIIEILLNTYVHTNKYITNHYVINHDHNQMLAWIACTEYSTHMGICLRFMPIRARYSI